VKKSIVGYVWFTSTNCVGIVLTRTEQEEYKAFIGLASGKNIQRDIRQIADWGAKFPYREAISLITQFGTWISPKD